VRPRQARAVRRTSGRPGAISHDADSISRGIDRLDRHRSSPHEAMTRRSYVWTSSFSGQQLVLSAMADREFNSQEHLCLGRNGSEQQKPS
jgi:hypothetical protein